MTTPDAPSRSSGGGSADAGVPAGRRVRPAPRRSAAWSRHDVVTGAVLGLLVVYFLTALLRFATDDHPLSFIDEHTHLDTQFKVHNGHYPYRGALYGAPMINEWACGVGHQAGPTLVPCGDPTLGPDDLVSGKYTTGYIHYPTYFVGGEAFRTVVETVAGERHPLSVYRAFGALMMGLGVVLCGFLSWRFGLRGSALVAATLTPVAASQIVMFGTMVNPMSTSILAGALIGAAGLRWVQTGRGYWWLVAATAFAASLAVTDSLPGGAFVLVTAVGALLLRRGRTFDTAWRPRFWQALVLVGVLVAPILGFGQVIAQRATRSDDTVYADYGFDSWTPILVGSVRELISLHNPWQEATILEVTNNSTFELFVRSFGYGIPLWVTIVVFGSVVLGALGVVQRVRPAVGARRADRAPGAALAASGDDARAPLSAVGLLSAAVLAGVLLYPPALRISNAITAGVDYFIVDRYTMAFTPLLVWLALLATRDRRGVGRVLAVLAAVCVVSLGVTAW